MAFNLADMLRDVSDSDTGREQIEYISLDLIDQDPNNFYELSEVPALADNISLCGLQQPIRVRKQEGGRYQIVSGHRRRAALEMLVADGYDKWQEAPCIVEQDAVSPTLQQLRLIYANANTRKMTSAEIGEQAKQVEELLYRLKEEGYDFPGRMRDHVAEAVSVSKSKLARLKVIRENLDASWTDDWKSGRLTESQAYTLAQMPPFWQSIIKTKWGYSIGSLHSETIAKFRARFETVQNIKCTHGLSVCEHTVSMMEKNVCSDWSAPCMGCCFDCDKLQTCKVCCPEAAGKKKELKEIAKEASLAAKREQDERNRPGAEFARTVWQRIGQARKYAGTSVAAIVKARGESIYNPSYDDDKQEKMENGEGSYGPESLVSFGYNIFAKDLMRVVAVADTLGCSVDYLLGRTDQMEIVSKSGTAASYSSPVSNSGTHWRRDDPEKRGTYLLMLKDHGCDPIYEEWQWDGQRWKDWSGFHNPNIDGEVIGWIPMPSTPVSVSESGTSQSGSCITGMSPSGHCGAAAYCNEDHTCCLQCDDDSCNGRCGWIGK